MDAKYLKEKASKELLQSRNKPKRATTTWTYSKKED